MYSVDFWNGVPAFSQQATVTNNLTQYKVIYDMENLVTSVPEQSLPGRWNYISDGIIK